MARVTQGRAMESNWSGWYLGFWWKHLLAARHGLIQTEEDDSELALPGPGNLDTEGASATVGSRMVRFRDRSLTIRNDLMQSDALSPLLFCLTIAPISYWIRNNVSPYRTVTDLYSDWEDMAAAKTGIQCLFGQLGLELNARQCASCSLNHAISVQMDSIPVLGRTELYKYLGAEQNGLVCINELYDRVELAAGG
ncbi:unnamed protein product [Cylicostephanus goldi]|uniref:Uncharacterized protein n=1 Tax=Cylicostephanus goldi TaxID=71465 RepID=A0A3P7MS70_CYLGO|nr:unnamed protein product [Cylicostephanus goldi]